MTRTGKVTIRTSEREDEMFRLLVKKYGMDVSNLVRSMAAILACSNQDPRHFHMKAAVARAGCDIGHPGKVYTHNFTPKRK